MSYNTDLQNNNTNLQNVLAKVNTLPSKDAVEIKKWIFTLEDDTTVEKYVEVPKEVHTITYDLEDGITSSNTATTIVHGDVYETTLSSYNDGSYWLLTDIYYEIWPDIGHGIISDDDECVPDPQTPWLSHILIPNAWGNITIRARHSSDGWEDDGDEEPI